MSLPAQLMSLCLLRSGPQELPHSFGLARNLLLADVALQMAYSLVDEIASPLPRILLSVLLTLALPWALLQLRQRGERYLQTLSALVGTSLLISLLFLPVVLFATSLPTPQAGVPATAGQLVVMALWLFVIAWQLTVIGHIYRHALDWPQFAAAMLALGLFICQVGLDRMLFGTSA